MQRDEYEMADFLTRASKESRLVQIFYHPDDEVKVKTLSDGISHLIEIETISDSCMQSGKIVMRGRDEANIPASQRSNQK